MSKLTVFVGLEYHQSFVQICALDSAVIEMFCKYARHVLATTRFGNRPFLIQ